jgi:hypothetical protein
MVVKLALTPICKEEYQKAVEWLTALAQTDTSGGRAAAQVVLSAYNGSDGLGITLKTAGSKPALPAGAEGCMLIMTMRTKKSGPLAGVAMAPA